MKTSKPRDPFYAQKKEDLKKEKGCDYCRNQHGRALPGRWAEEFVLSGETIWYCGAGEETGISIKFCPWCARSLQDDNKEA